MSENIPPQLPRDGWVELPVKQRVGVVYPRQYPVEGVQKYQPYVQIINRLVEEFNRAASRIGLRIIFSEKQLLFSLVPELPASVLLPSELLIGKTQQELDFEALRKANEGIGGIGVTARDLKSIHKSFGSYFEDVLMNEHVRKVTFVGNGLSLAPLELAQQCRVQGKQLEVAVVDLFSYQALNEALSALEKSWQLEFPVNSLHLHPQLELFRELVSSLLAGEVIVSPKYRFQVEPPSGESSVNAALPAEIQDSQVVVNYMGPPFSTIIDQLRIFSASGPVYLLTVVDVEEVQIPPGWTRADLGSSSSQQSFHDTGPKAVVFYRE